MDSSTSSIDSSNERRTEMRFELIVEALEVEIARQRQELQMLRKMLLAKQNQGDSMFSPSLYDVSPATPQPDAATAAAAGSGSGGGKRHWHDEVEGIVRDALRHHMKFVDERIAASITERLRRVTRRHIEATVEREVKRHFRDAKLDGSHVHHELMKQYKAFCAERCRAMEHATAEEVVERSAASSDVASSFSSTSSDRRRHRRHDHQEEVGVPQAKGRIHSSEVRSRGSAMEASNSTWMTPTDEDEVVLRQLKELQQRIRNARFDSHHYPSAVLPATNVDIAAPATRHAAKQYEPAVKKKSDEEEREAQDVAAMLDDTAVHSSSNVKAFVQRLKAEEEVERRRAKQD